ncbi:type II secretion system protein GspJ [Tateyamaria sp. SN3-11]|uniref:type II secretion system protein GspJ n=1 Tax=Tateyamaria sp. SN3-11 TaxID=3092147 RepID=UPI0039E796B3
MTAPIPNTRARQAGFTLIELVAVLAIFSMVSLMGLQSITSLVRSRDQLVEVQDRSEALAYVLTLLRSDLQHAVALPFQPPGGAAEGALVHDRAALRITTAGRGSAPGAVESGMIRVIWRHDASAATLTRQVWPGLAPANSSARGPEQVVLSDVRGVTIASYSRDDKAWRAAFGADEGLPKSSLPDAVEVTIETDAPHPLRVVVARP